MRFVFQLAVVVVCAGLSLAAVSADKSKTGSIQGRVDFCAEGGVEGMQVYIPGLPYLVITGKGGTFQLLNLPEGKYDIHYRVGERLLNRNPSVGVSPGSATDLSVISFCDHFVAAPKPASKSTTMPAPKPIAVPVPVQPEAAIPSAKMICGAGSVDPSCQDADGDGVRANQDCDDNDAKTYPGAHELCDGKDNNCNSQVDENALVIVQHGIGMCQAGKAVVQSCKDGFSDCDGQAANGCEVDINNDTEHCGACNDDCTPTEVCVTGECI